MKQALVLGALGLVLVGQAPAIPLPPPLETAHLLGAGLPSGAPPLSLEDELFVLGWSRANALAVLERRSLSPGEKETRIRVVDLVEDKVLAEEHWADWGDETQMAAWWQHREPQVDGIFRRFDLTPTTWQLGAFPLILDNEFYTPVLRRVIDSGDSRWITQLEILIHSTGRGLKTVKVVDGYWRWATLLGFVPSPFENRLAVVLLVQPVGWAGEKQPLRFLVTGLSLKAGFPKP